MHPRINLITLGVSNLETSVAFYRDLLGLPYSDKSTGDVAFFELNGTWLGLFPTKELAKDADLSEGAGTNAKGFRGVSMSQNLESEKEVDEFFEMLAKKGVTITKPPTKAEWGGYNGYFIDPDGHLWEVAYNPFFWLGPK